MYWESKQMWQLSSSCQNYRGKEWAKMKEKTKRKPGDCKWSKREEFWTSVDAKGSIYTTQTGGLKSLPDQPQRVTHLSQLEYGTHCTSSISFFLQKGIIHLQVLACDCQSRDICLSTINKLCSQQKLNRVSDTETGFGIQQIILGRKSTKIKCSEGR